MKKTLIALLALGAVAVGAENMPTTLVNIMQTKGENNVASTEVWGTDSLGLTRVSATTTITSAVSAKDLFGTPYANSMFAVNGTNVGENPGGTFTYALTFTTDFADGITEVDLSSFTLDIFTLNASGKTQNGDTDKGIYYDYHFKQGDTVLSESSTHIQTALHGTGYLTAEGGTAAYTKDPVSGAYTLGTYGTSTKPGAADYLSGGQSTLNLGQAVSLKNHTEYTLILDVERQTTGGFYVGFGNVALNGSAVPEPATGTLSLLALAGLMVHRRRK